MDTAIPADNLEQRVKRFCFFSMVAVLGSWSSVAFAETNAPPATADGVDGLPGMYRVPVVGEAAPRLGASLWANYGWTEAQNDSSGSHHRFGGTAALGGALWRYLGVGLRLDVRHDIHPSDDLGKDSGTVIDWTPLLRVAVPLGAFRIGLEGRALFAGATVQDGIAGPTPEGRLLGSYVDHGWYVSAYAGYRTPYNGHDSINQEELREGDRVALGVSEFSSLVTGVGLMKKLPAVTLLGELTWEMMLGQGAPSVLQSPFRVGLGARRELVPGINLQAIVEVAPGKRAPSGPDDPLVPIDPRLSVIFGLSVRLPDLVAKQDHKASPGPKKEEEVVEETKPAVVPVVVAPPPAQASLTVEVVDETGHPISDARVTVEVPATEHEPARVIDVPLSAINAYLSTELPPGLVELSIVADRLQSYTQQIELVADEEQKLKVKLRKAAGVDGQLRGLVRSYTGRGIKAQVRVVPGDKIVSCNEQGEFEIDLPPGDYSVIIDAEGYAPQKRPLRIRKDGVTVLNADLHQSN